MEVKIEKYLVIIKCFQLLFIQLLSAAIVESIKSNEIFMQLGKERLVRSPLINVTPDITTTRKTSLQTTDCSVLPNCLRCNENGCIKCTNFMMRDTRQCLEKCPSKYINQWSSSSELMGQICVQSSISNSIQTVFVGIICGVFLCFFVVFICVVILKKRQQKLHKKLIKDQLINDECDQIEFIRQLDDLRPYSEYFLFMLNDTRKQIRNSFISGDKTAAAKFYPIIRDLAKILIILNRPIEVIDGPPHDWNRLLQWADRILVQYKSQQTKEFIEFLQSSTSQSSSRIFNNEDTRLVSDHSTFKSLFYSTPIVENRKKIVLPVIPSDSTKHSNNNQKCAKDVRYLSTQMQFDHFTSKKYICTENLQEFSQSDYNHDKNICGSLITLQDFVNESQHKIVNKKHYSSNFDNHSKGSLQVVDDDLIEFKLGLRPQDEIITEL
ncbi:uncharacterized protein T48 [Chironomus tepperi]|uniref:uncharacterized protein T48 n=1 Tax=Chironomus tepperi TaxID=113505 RepID=UPI00391F85F5